MNHKLYDTRVPVSMSFDQKEWIELKASYLEMSISEFVRQNVFPPNYQNQIPALKAQFEKRRRK